jgi:hypothetical protein
MTISAPPALTAPPSPAPSRTDSANFAARSDLYHAWRVINSPEETAALAWTYATAVEVYGLATAAQTDRIAAQTAANAIAAQSPVSNAAAAAASAAAAAVSATLAQATNPDSPIRLNPREINANVNISSDYNAASVGPIVINEGITVTINNNATWSIH